MLRFLSSGRRLSRDRPASGAGRAMCGRIGYFLPLTLLATACGEAPANRSAPLALDARGPGARIIAQEWWFQFALGALIFLGVMALLAYIIASQRERRQRSASTVDLSEGDQGLKWIWLGGIVLPVLVLSAVYGVSLRNTLDLQTPPQEESLLIEIVGHRWWWEVRYPQYGIITANQIHVPAGEAVRVSVASNDVIHSFWVPQLQRKVDLIPGEVNSIWLQADEPGVFRGLCAEFCGLQHARMHFLLVSMPPERYEQWLAQEQSAAAEPQTALTRMGQEVFLSSSCVYCHQIRGTPAAGSVGPDLTHLAGRYTLAAGTLENNRGNLGGWIRDPQHIKPGALMPPTPLSGIELQALLAYLSSLE